MSNVSFFACFVAVSLSLSRVICAAYIEAAEKDKKRVASVPRRPAQPNTT
jgi:hypothetical protein